MEDTTKKHNENKVVVRDVLRDLNRKFMENFTKQILIRRSHEHPVTKAAEDTKSNRNS